MTIKFTDNTELESLGAHGRSYFYQGVQRDCLTFLFDPDAVSLVEVIQKFTPENCSAIYLINGDKAYLHEHYTIRVEAGIGYEEHVLEGSVRQNTKQCIFVKMAQSTLAERKLLEQQAAIEALIIAELEG